MKLIRSKQDLAINGAPPAFEHPLYVGRPNIGNHEAFLKYAKDILDRQCLSNNGPIVQELEQRVADHHNVKHCIAMSNGTVALEIAIRALGLEGEVIIPSYTFIATAHALQWQGITPIFADIDPTTHNLDPESVLNMITPKTTGIIGVHLWGRAAPVEALQTIADEYNLKLIFDSAHAFGCSYKGEMIGRFGACEVLSFHATKFFNTFEGGAILTNDDELAKTTQQIRNFGFIETDNVTHLGTNGKMIEIAAAMGLVNFDSIDEVIKVNRCNYETYQEEFSELSGITLLNYNKSEHNNYQYVVIEVGQESPVTRDQILQALHSENILARKYFWPGCHNMKHYHDLNPNAGRSLPNTKQIAERVVVLPTGTAIDSEKIRTITSVIRVLVEDTA